MLFCHRWPIKLHCTGAKHNAGVHNTGVAGPNLLEGEGKEAEGL